MPHLPVVVWGFSDKDLGTFPQGSPIEDGNLSSSSFPFNWPKGNTKGSQKWNEKPEVNVNVFRFLGKFDVGYSGGPVCYSVDYTVVGVFTAKDNDNGYVIPIETILGKFEQLKVTDFSPSMVNMFSYLQKAMNSYNKGDYNETLRLLEVVLQDPNYVGPMFFEGIVLGNLGKNKEAIEWFDRVLSIKPNDINTLGVKGFALSRLGKYDEAIECFDKVLAIDPNNNHALNSKGEVLGNLGKYEEAIEYFDKVLAIDPIFISALINKAKALASLEKYTDAIEYFDKVLAIDPNNVAALNNKGEVFRKLKKYEVAITYYDKVLAIDPNNIQVLFGKANALYNLGKYEKKL
jgi:tetratricopeptide (TPR) repeat protein